VNKIGIVVVDDAEEIRNYFKMILSKENDMQVVGEASNGKEAYDVVAKTKPDIVLMDIQMETETAGIDAIKRINEEFDCVKTIVLTVHEEDELLFQAYTVGAMDYIVKTSSIVDIIQSIRNVYKNEMSLRPEIAEKIISEFSRLRTQQSSLIYTLNIISKLTNSEFEILKAVYNGNSYKQITNQRCVEEVTIRTQVNKILKKFQMRSMKDVIRLLKGMKFFEIYNNL
jgi:DNA-binding NarL/FixJ family response regulator